MFDMFTVLIRILDLSSPSLWLLICEHSPIMFFLQVVKYPCINLPSLMLGHTTTTTTKPFVPSIWGRLHEPKENYSGSGTWISFLHSFLSSNMPSLRHLASISCRITSIHVFFGLPCALLTCPKLIRSTRWTDAL